MPKHFEVRIDKTCRDTLSDRSQRYDTQIEKFHTLEEVAEFFLEHYGCIPGGRTKIYRDLTDDSTIEIGFMHSFWTDEINSLTSYFETDWIEITEVEHTVINLRSIRKTKVARWAKTAKPKKCTRKEA